MRSTHPTKPKSLFQDEKDLWLTRKILDELTRILRDLLFDETIVLTETTKRSDIPAWDSFSYVNFMVAVEMQYGIRFGVAEVESFTTVGEIASRVEQLTNAL